jgi:hypothetical protein
MKTHEEDLTAIRQILFDACGHDAKLPEETVRIILKVLLTSRTPQLLVRLVADIQRKALDSASVAKKPDEIVTALLAVKVRKETTA